MELLQNLGMRFQTYLSRRPVCVPLSWQYVGYNVLYIKKPTFVYVSKQLLENSIYFQSAYHPNCEEELLSLC